MAIRDFTELLCWQLAHELKCEVIAFTDSGPASKDFRYRDQIRDASASAPRNIAEGFDRYLPGEFANFLRYARGSLGEVRNHLIDGRDRSYLDERLYARLTNLARAARRTTTRLMVSKLRQAAEEKGGERKDRSSRRVQQARRHRST